MVSFEWCSFFFFEGFFFYSYVYVLFSLEFFKFVCLCTCTSDVFFSFAFLVCSNDISIVIEFFIFFYLRVWNLGGA